MVKQSTVASLPASVEGQQTRPSKKVSHPKKEKYTSTLLVCISDVNYFFWQFEEGWLVNLHLFYLQDSQGIDIKDNNHDNNTKLLNKEFLGNVGVHD